eukprot:403367326
MKYLEEEQTFDYSKQEYKTSLDLFDQDKNGQADIEDIKRVLETYSSLDEAQIQHFIKLNLMNDPNINDDEKYEQFKSINIKESKNTQLKEGQNREKQYQPSEEDPRLEVQYEDEDNLTKSNKNADGNQEQFGNNDDFVNRDRACKIDWEGIGIQQPNFVNFITPITNQGDSTNNQFLVSAENAVHQFDINSKTGIFEHLGTVIPHDKTINMTTMLNQELFLVCSRDPIVRMFELPSQSNLNQSNFDKLTQPQAEFIGHTMSVTSITASSCQQFIASGSRDQTTRLWDIESQKQLQSRLIERNAITFLKWLPNHQDRFIECSEDLTLRLWDIRSKPFKPQIEFKVGANFATTCDILSEGTDDKYLVTGHRGFNDVGADIKLWDLRNFSQESLKWTYTKHSVQGPINACH